RQGDSGDQRKPEGTGEKSHNTVLIVFTVFQNFTGRCIQIQIPFNTLGINDLNFINVTSAFFFQFCIIDSATGMLNWKKNADVTFMKLRSLMPRVLNGIWIWMQIPFNTLGINDLNFINVTSAFFFQFCIIDSATGMLSQSRFIKFLKRL